MICSGAELETGWLPLLLRQAGNANVLPGKTGYFEASAFVQRLDIPVTVDRSMGDVHAGGNPHVHLDPRRIAKIAIKLTERMQQLDPEGVRFYQHRQNDFDQRWQKAISQWQQLAIPLKGKRVVVHHKDWVYLFNWLDIKIAGALEPKPGLPTTVGHLVELKQALEKSTASMIVYTAYQSPRAAKRFSQMAGLTAIELPYTIGGAKEVDDLFSLFDITIKRLLGGLK